MSKETNKDKGMLAIGAAITFCGLSLYAAERVLKYLFRDVDPDRTDITEVDEKDTADTEDEDTESSEIE